MATFANKGTHTVNTKSALIDTTLSRVTLNDVWLHLSDSVFAIDTPLQLTACSMFPVSVIWPYHTIVVRLHRTIRIQNNLHMANLWKGEDIHVL